MTPKLARGGQRSAFALGGSASSPFVDVKEASLDVDLDALPLARYVEYVTLPLAAKVKDGALTTRLKIAFVTDKGRAEDAEGERHRARRPVRAHAQRRHAARRAAKVDATIGEADPLARTVALERVAVDAPNVDLRRLSDGALEFVRLITPAAPAPPAARAASATAAAPARHGRCASPTRASATARSRCPTRRSIRRSRDAHRRHVLTATGLSTGDAPPARIEFAFDSDGARFDGNGELDVRKLAGARAFRADEVQPRAAVSVLRGRARARRQARIAGARRRFRRRRGRHAAAGEAHRRQRDAHRRRARGQRRARAAVAHSHARAHRHRVRPRAASRDDRQRRRPPATLRVVREADGTINFARLVRTTAQTGAGAPASRRAGRGRRRRDVGVCGAQDHARAHDRRRRGPRRRAAGQAASHRRTRRRPELQQRARRQGHARLPRARRERRQGGARRLDRHEPLRGRLARRRGRRRSHAAFASTSSRRRTSSSPGARSRPRVGSSSTPRQPGGTRTTYAGDVTISDFGALDRPTGQELVRWKTLTLTGVDTASAPPRLALGAVALDDFYARLIVNADATLNLQLLMASPDAAAATPAAATPRSHRPPPRPRPPAPTRTRAAATAPAAVDRQRARAAQPRRSRCAAVRRDANLPVSIGRIEVARGNVRLLRFLREAQLLGQPHRRRGQRVGDVGHTGRRRRARPRSVDASRRSRCAARSIRSRASSRSISPARRATSTCRRSRPTRRSTRATASRRASSSFDVHYRDREPQARRRQRARARPADVRRARRQPDRHQAAGAARGRAAQGPPRRDRHRAADLRLARRSAVLGRRTHRPRDRQPDHQGRDGAVRAPRRARRRRRAASRSSSSRRAAPTIAADGEDASSTRSRKALADRPALKLDIDRPRRFPTSIARR